MNRLTATVMYRLSFPELFFANVNYQQYLKNNEMNAEARRTSGDVIDEMKKLQF